MYVLTHHFTLLAMNANDGSLSQVDNLNPPAGLTLVNIDPAEVARLEVEASRLGKQRTAITTGPLSGYSYVKSSVPRKFHLFKNGFLCAPRGLATPVSDRGSASDWETFRFVTPETAAEYLRVPSQGGDRFEARVRALISRRTPVCLHFGCGPRLIKGYLNIDVNPYNGDSTNLEDYFIFDFAAGPWPIPDSSVDYIYSEDFIEHIPQKSQVAFLAESFRVLKTGSYHRINTPCLVASMRANSDFAKGFNGVYFGEWDKWEHISVLTRGFIADIGNAIGYRQVFFTAKSRGSSPYAVEDSRPWDDRGQELGNIFADLLK